METIYKEFATYLLIIAAILIVTLVFLIVSSSQRRNDAKELEKEFEEKQAEQRQFNNLMIKTLGELKNANSTDFLNFSNQINRNFKENNDANHQTILDIQERISKIDAAQSKLNSLSDDITGLQNILQDKKNRGTFGEIELYSLLETVFGNNNQRYRRQYQLSNGTTVDAVLLGGDTLGLIPIDSKFPLENYRRIYDDKLSRNEKESARKAFRSDVLKHINDISSKYIIEGETAEFAYMFIPSEAVFSEIYGNYQEVIDRSYEKKVYLVSPTTLMAYLTAIRSIYLGQQRDQKAKEIIIELNALSKDFERLKERSDAMYEQSRKFLSVNEQFNISVKKISDRFSKIYNVEDGREE